MHVESLGEQSSAPNVTIRILGPLAVDVDGTDVTPTAARLRRVLELLALSRTGVTDDQLIEALWPKRIPPTARNSLQVAISQLRTLMPTTAKRHDILIRSAAGYQLRTDTVDAEHFERLVHEADRETVVPLRSEKLDHALALWRADQVLAGDFDGVYIGRGRVDELQAMRHHAMRMRGNLHIETDEFAAAATLMAPLARSMPHDESIHCILARALYADGRSSDAAQVCTNVTTNLLEVGLEPSNELRSLHRAILENRDDEVLGRPRPWQRGVRNAQRHVPAPRNPGVPRPQIHQRIKDAFASGARFVNLVGPAGAGKTRTAHEYALDLQTEDPLVVAIALSACANSHEAESVIAAAIGAGHHTATPARVSIIRRLSGTGGMLVLDNLEHLPGMHELIDEILAAAPSLRVLGTSRVALDMYGEHLVKIGGLDTVDALALLRLRADALDDTSLSGVPDSSLQPLVELVSHLPLAIELLAVSITRDGLHDTTQRLRETTAALTESQRGMEQRHGTVASAIDWSLDLLEHSDLQLLLDAATFEGAIDSHWLRQMQTPVDDYAASLHRLASWHLLAFNDEDEAEPSIRLLRVVRDVARERDSAREQDARRLRYRQVILDSVEDLIARIHGPDELEVAAELERLSADIRSVTSMLETVDRQAAAKLACTLGWHSMFCTRSHEAGADIEKCLAAPQDLDPDVVTELRCWHVLIGLRLGMKRDIATGLDDADAQDPELAGLVLLARSLWLGWNEARIEEAQQLAQDVLAMENQHPATLHLAGILNVLFTGMSGDRAQWDEAATTLMQLPGTWTSAQADRDNQIGSWQAITGAMDDDAKRAHAGMARLRDAIDVFDRRGDLLSYAHVAQMIASCSADLRLDPDDYDARRLTDEAVRRSREAGEVELETFVLGARILLDTIHGPEGRAMDDATAVIRACLARDYPRGTQTALSVIAAVRARRGEYPNAARTIAAYDRLRQAFPEPLIASDRLVQQARDLVRASSAIPRIDTDPLSAIAGVPLP